MKAVNLSLGRVPVSESWRAGGPRDRGARVWTCGPALSTPKDRAKAQLCPIDFEVGPRRIHRKLDNISEEPQLWPGEFFTRLVPVYAVELPMYLYFGFAKCLGGATSGILPRV